MEKDHGRPQIVLTQPHGPFDPYRLRGEFARWLAGMPWTGFGTFTFRKERHSDRSCLGSFKTWRRDLWRDHGLACDATVVVEGSDRTRLHLHALLCMHYPRGSARYCAPASPKLRRRAAWELWKARYGRARIDTPGMGSPYYVAKYCFKGGRAAEPRSHFLTHPGWPDNIGR